MKTRKINKKFIKKRRRTIKQKGGQENTTAYVINLDKNIDRWERIQKDFEKSSIHLERVSAILEPNRGHLGCGKSFQKIVKMAKEANLKEPAKFNTVLIFEDDNMPLENFDKRWQITKQWLDSNMDKWDIFNGGVRFMESFKKFTAKLKYKLDKDVNLFIPNYFFGNNWIYINKSAYDKVLAWDIDIHNNIDHYFSNLHMNTFKVLCIYPYLALQYNGFSNTGSQNVNFNSEHIVYNNRFKEILNSQ